MATVVSFHAHPDDEALLTGGWLAQRAAAGDRVVLVFATDGGAGLTSAAGPVGTLGVRRRAEAYAAARALGAAAVVWLGYADSGMADAPSGLVDRFADAPLADAARRLAAVLDEEDADVLTGYDANGGYGHPDHVQVHHVARAAQALAARPPYLLEATRDRTWLARGIALLRPFARALPGLTLPGRDIYSARPRVSLRVDVRDQLPAKRAALAAHTSQATGGVRTLAVLRLLPTWLARRVLGTEWFIEVPGRAAGAPASSP
ncbi:MULTISPECIES: PIG-L family deacetylase [unclassified Nocardioides]|uniref:PIG-L family deacetylase n=1 Tax=unclassified Nocardioides TaxID=2615069 RepID=UPI0000EB61EB|nr:MULTISPECIES: PIG-L family deacetylase [unclassified Nocardioides]ABL81575.1 LmbE family protein [Nocardioides sp. JS614]